jgi:hypothetical protein
MKPTPEQIAKLPKWAQDHIQNIERERFTAVRALNEYCDETTKSPFVIEDSVCTGESTGPSTKRRYIQAPSMKVEYGGVELRISANDYNGRRGIELSWSTLNYGHDDICMSPLCRNSVELITKEAMR